MNIKLVFIGYNLRKSLVEAVERIKNRIRGFEFIFYDTYLVDKDLVDLDKVKHDLKTADLVLLDVRGGDRVSKLVTDILGKTDNYVVALVGGSSELINLTRLGSFSMKSFEKFRENPFFKKVIRRKSIDYEFIVKMRNRFEKISKILPFKLFRDAQNYFLIQKYYENPNTENMYSMLLLLLKEYFGFEELEKPDPPIELPQYAILDPRANKFYDNVEDYLRNYELKDKRLIGLLFYGGHHFDQQIQTVKRFIREFEKRGFGVIPVLSSDLRYYIAIEKFFMKNGKPLVDIVIDLLWFRFAGGPLGGDHSKTFNVLKRLNTLFLHGIHLSSYTLDQWLESRHGVPPVETVTTIILPELDGRFEPFVVLGPVKRVYQDYIVEEYIPVTDRVDKMVRRAIKWSNLRRKENSEKKIAIIIYNYPPGPENLGKAGYLDVFSSLANLLDYLRENGYSIPTNISSDWIKDKLLEIIGKCRDGVCNECNGLITVKPSIYLEWFNELPRDTREEVIKNWGRPPGELMVCNEGIVIPGVLLGNVFIGVQPTRGVHENPDKIYHDRELPPHHQYIAFYKWLEKIFRADAIIHLGTHGTLEFLPGKDIGLSHKCFPDILIGDLPNIYVYHVSNPSEASIAKRRSYALIINHNTPVLTTSDLPEELLEIEKLINQYYEVKQYGGGDDLEKIIFERAEKQGLTGESIDEIHDKLYEYKYSLIPKGLYVLGSKPSREDIIDYLVAISRFDRGEVKGLYRLVVEDMGYSYDELLDKPSGRTESGKLYSEVLDEASERARSIIIETILKNNDPWKILTNTKRLRAYIESIEYLKKIYRAIVSSNELKAIVKALNTEYIEPGPGGDPIRNPSIYPVGRNMYQLDPTNIPTETAWIRGRLIVDKLIEDYRRKHGRYPETISFILWGFETMTTGGETIAAILYLLGVKPIWKSIYIRDLEVIPLEKLGRPRIDVVVNICGIFRDTFYNLVELLDQAFKLVANLDEPLDMNYVKAHYLEDEKLYGEVYRIYGPPEGLYATSLTKLIETGKWVSTNELVNAYIESMRYGYGGGKRSVCVEDLFKNTLSRVDLVAQIRSHSEYELIDLDHYYEFLGGLKSSVEKQRGGRVDAYFIDSTRERVKVESISDSIKRSVWTRLLNPKWIDSMINSGFNGVRAIADRVENLLGLTVLTDSVEDWVWDKVYEKLVLDRERAERMKEINPYAYEKILRKLLEARERGYWKPSIDIEDLYSEFRDL